MTPDAAVDSSRATPIAPVRVLLQSVVDYAGLFPPTSLGMAAGAAEYAVQRTGDQSWLLGRFGLPAARLDEFEGEAAALLPRDGASSWALSALLGGDIEQDLGRVEAFNDRHRDARLGAVHVDTVELKAHTPRDVARAGELLDRRFDTYREGPVHEAPAEVIAAISKTCAKAKIRTGGVTPDLFPVAAHVIRFMRACIDERVAFKATAGLHHAWRAESPLTYAPDAARGTMFGFLNVLLAVAGLHAGLSDAEAIALLEERDPRAFVFSGDGARWRDHSLSSTALAAARESMASFGSCSFREPVADLRAASLL